MEIDIDLLTEEELIELNHRIVERLKMLSQMRVHQKMLDFKVGQKVWFTAPDGRKVTGTLTRHNQKTVTIVSEDGHRWNVSPGFLKPVEKNSPSAKPGKGFKAKSPGRARG